MKLAYFDCFSGIGGEMLLGALVDAGCDLPHVMEQLQSLPFSGWKIDAQKVSRQGFAATEVTIDCSGASLPSLDEIDRIIGESSLPFPVAENTSKILRTLGEAEVRTPALLVGNGRIQQSASIANFLEILGVVIGFAQLGVGEFACSALNTAHLASMEASGGRRPTDANSPLSVPPYESRVPLAIVTPVGAAIAATLASQFGPQPAMTVTAVGMGAGRGVDGEGGFLRLFIGDSEPARADDCLDEELVVLEASLDDANPQVYAYFAEIALREGALDVFATPSQMRGNCPGLVATVLCELSAEKRLTDLLFRETSARGLRRRCVQRRSLRREHVTVTTTWGPIRVKLARKNGQVLNAAPEFDDCKNAAVRHGVPLKVVLAEASFQFRKFYQF